MATYYIDPTGSDTSGNGSIGTPWKTLYKACSTVTTAGNTIHVNPGTYTETTRISLAVGVSIEGDGDSSIITATYNTSLINYGPNGSNGDAIINLVTGSGSVVSGNQTISYLKFDGASLASSHALYIMNRSNVKVHHTTAINFRYCYVVWWANPNSLTLTGSEFYNNTVTNCGGYNYQDGSFYASLYCGSHTGMLIHDNTMVNNDSHNTPSGNAQGWPIKFWLWDGRMYGCKIYNNWLEKTNFNTWDFAIESNNEDGMEIYNNTILGGIDLNHQTYSGTYPYSVWIHDNVIGFDSNPGGQYSAGITLEHEDVNVIIERNLIKWCGPGILFTPRATTQTNVIIRYNVFRNCHSTTVGYSAGIVMNPGGAMAINGFYVYNNVIHGTAAYGIRFMHNTAAYTIDNFRIINNVIQGFSSGAPVYFTGGGTLSNLYIRKNIFYGNGNSNNPLLSTTPSPYYSDTPIKLDPQFVVAGSDFHLQATSPAINAGEDVGLTTDFENNPVSIPPEIGAYEYGGLSTATDILTFTIPQQYGTATVNATTHAVTCEVLYGTSLTSLTPTITLSTGATISPTSGTSRDFTNPVTYTVTAEDTVTTQVWTVTVTVTALIAPVVTTTTITAITDTTATGGGNVTSSGGGTVSARGVCWNTSTDPTIANLHTTNGTGTGVFVSSLVSLTPGVHYYVRAYVITEYGVAYGSNVQFDTTGGGLPEVTTNVITAITDITATSGGNVTSAGSGTVSARGVCWGISTNPTIVNDHTTDGSGLGTFVSSLIGLVAGTHYYVRAYATSEYGTAYGANVEFDTAGGIVYVLITNAKVKKWSVI